MNRSNRVRSEGAYRSNLSTGKREMETRGGFSSGQEMKEESAVPLWLITFTDVMALMLTFFVLLYSMAVPEESKWTEVTAAMNKEFGTYSNPALRPGPLDTIDIQKIAVNEALNLNYLRTILADLISKNEELTDIVLRLQKDRLIISLPDVLLFESGGSEVSLGGKKALFSLGGALSHIRNRIEVIGHTDPSPIQNPAGGVASNWELSLLRAANVAAVLDDVGYDRPIVIRGLSSGRYDELPDDMGEAERLKVARRVDLVIMKDDGKKKLLFKL